MQFTSQRNARELIALIAEKKLKVTPLITQRLKIEDVGTGCDMLIDHPELAVGVILEY